MRHALYPIAAIVIFATLLITATADRLAAQGEPTTQPTAAATAEKPLIEKVEIEMLFPVMVHFWLVLNAKDSDVAATSIRLTQPGRADGIDRTIRLRLPEEGQFINEEVAFFNHLWRLTPDDAPRPFTVVHYEWSVEMKDGRRAEQRGEFVFQDTLAAGETPVTTWNFIEGRVSLYSHNPELALNIVQAGVLRAYDRLRADFGLDKLYRLVVYDPETAFCRVEEGRAGAPDSLYLASAIFPEYREACDPAQAARLYAKYGFAIVRRPNFAIDQLQDRIIALMAGDALDTLWGAAHPPAWLREGLIQFYGLMGRSQALALARTAGRTDGLLPLAAMDEALPEDNAERARLWRAQSYLLVMYLAARFGAGAPLNVALRVRDGFSFEGVFTTFYGVSLSALYDDWRTWIFTDAAQAAMRWTPYTSLTPTPTGTARRFPSLTPTSDQPTATRTPPPTITPLPRASNTPVPPRPTPTPLPPGSFNTPVPSATPLPPPLISFESGAGAGLVLLAAGIGIAVAAALIGIVIRRRRGRR